MTETQKFFVGETVAVVDANNRLRFATIVAPSVDDDDETDRVHVKWNDSNGVANPRRDRVAHL